MLEVMSTIIAVYGRQNEGKSETIKNVCKILLANFPNVIPSIPIQDINYNSDILLTIQLGTILIGIESQGDPNSRMIYDDTVKDLVNQKCDIIICATRTDGMTVQKVDNIAASFQYRVIWKSSYYNSGCNNNVLNFISAEEIVNLIKSIIIGQI